MRRVIIAVMFLIAVVLMAAVLWRHGHRQPAPLYETAHARANHITVWNSTAQIREPVTTLNFGERVDVLQKYADLVNVQTPAGVSGWVEERDLISQDVWQRATALAIQAARMPVQASGRTRAPANLHLDAGRGAPTLVELSRDLPVQMLERRVITPGPPGGSKNASPPSSVAPSVIRHHAASATTTAATAAAPSTEEWWLIRTEVKDMGPAAGWTLGRFIALTAPDPLPDYSTAANMRLIAWFILNRVSDDNDGAKPQYLAAGLRPSEGGDYDFSLLRVYTWGTKRARYETAYVEDNLRGKLPIRVTPASSLGGDSEFRFTNASAGGNSGFVYQMKQTSVRRIQGGPPREKSHARGGSKSHARPPNPA
jgi:hypothetical protein